jgi:hypothetical protein
MLLNELFGNNFSQSNVYSVPAIISREKKIQIQNEDKPPYIQWEELERTFGEKINGLNHLCSNHFNRDPARITEKDVEMLQDRLEKFQIWLEKFQSQCGVGQENISTDNSPTDNSPKN